MWKGATSISGQQPCTGRQCGQCSCSSRDRPLQEEISWLLSSGDGDDSAYGDGDDDIGDGGGDDSDDGGGVGELPWKENNWG